MNLSYLCWKKLFRYSGCRLLLKRQNLIFQSVFSVCVCSEFPAMYGLWYLLHASNILFPEVWLASFSKVQSMIRPPLKRQAEMSTDKHVWMWKSPLGDDAIMLRCLSCLLKVLGISVHHFQSGIYHCSLFKYH